MILTLLLVLAFGALFAAPVGAAYYLHIHEPDVPNDPLGTWIGRTERWEGEE